MTKKNSRQSHSSQPREIPSRRSLELPKMSLYIRHFVETKFSLNKDRSTHSISIISMRPRQVCVGNLGPSISMHVAHFCRIYSVVTSISHYPHRGMPNIFRVCSLLLGIKGRSMHRSKVSSTYTLSADFVLPKKTKKFCLILSLGYW